MGRKRQSRNSNIRPNKAKFNINKNSYMKGLYDYICVTIGTFLNNNLSYSQKYLRISSTEILD